LVELLDDDGEALANLDAPCVFCDTKPLSNQGPSYGIWGMSGSQLSVGFPQRAAGEDTRRERLVDKARFACTGIPGHADHAALAFLDAF
jgi:hypothetical protein